MSSTRRAAAGSELKQERFLSSTSLPRGLIGNVVARRMACLKSESHRLSIRFLQELSLRDLAIARHPTCVAMPAWPWKTSDQARDALDQASIDLSERFGLGFADATEVKSCLVNLCLDPAFDPINRTDPREQRLIAALDDYRHAFCQAYRRLLCVTKTTRELFDLLDFAAAQICGGFVLAEGAHRTGKSFSAQMWCQLHIGGARYVQLSSSTSDAEFYRDIARALGIGAGGTRKAAELRFRVTEALVNSGELLVLDEADWICPQGVRPRAAPERLNWLMTGLVNQGVPIALIGSRNFNRMLSNFERKCPVWGSAQFWGRLRHRITLPSELDQADLIGVARLYAPEADARMCMMLAGYALYAKGHIAVIESITARARFKATKAKRPMRIADIEAAMAEDGYRPGRAAASPPEYRDEVARVPRCYGGPAARR